jgi:rhodanese-related sulfurtransferase
LGHSGRTGLKSIQVSTDDLRGSAIVLDSRKRAEYFAGHIAGARNVVPHRARAAGERPAFEPYPIGDLDKIFERAHTDEGVALWCSYQR